MFVNTVAPASALSYNGRYEQMGNGSSVQPNVTNIISNVTSVYNVFSCAQMCSEVRFLINTNYGCATDSSRTEALVLVYNLTNSWLDHGAKFSQFFRILTADWSNYKLTQAPLSADCPSHIHNTNQFWIKRVFEDVSIIMVSKTN